MSPKSDVELSATSAARPRRRWLPRFGLRSLLIVGLAGSLILAFVGRELHRRYREAAVVDELLQAGAFIHFQHDRGEGGFWYSQTEAPDPYGLNWLVGENFFANAARVQLSSDRGATQDHVALLPRLSHLEGVELYGPAFDDASIDPLGRCERLKDLTIGGTRITGSGLARLANRERIESFRFYESESRVADSPVARIDSLPNLKTCELSYSPLTKARLRSIAKLPRLETLLFMMSPSIESGALEELAPLDSVKELTFGNAIAIPFGDAEVQAIAELEALEHLGFNGDNVTDAGLAPVTRLTHLRRLYASLPNVTDAGVAELARIETLEEVSLTGTQMTDAGLDALLDLPNLRTVYFGTGVSQAAAKRFAAARPRCRVHCWVGPQLLTIEPTEPPPSTSRNEEAETATP